MSRTLARWQDAAQLPRGNGTVRGISTDCGFAIFISQFCASLTTKTKRGSEMLTWAYWYRDETDEPPTIQIDGVEYRKIFRLPRNVREGDAIVLFDGVHSERPYSAYAIVTGVDFWRKEIRGYNVYHSTTQIAYRIAPGQLYGYVFAPFRHMWKFTGDSNSERIAIYRKVSG